MNWLKKASLVALATFLLIGGVGTLAYPQGAATLVQIINGSAIVSSTNGLPVNCVTGCSGGGGGGAVFGPTAQGSPAANPPVIIGGTVDGTATGNVDNAKVVGGNLSINGAVLSHASTAALGTSLVAKASTGNLYAFNCAGITGGAAGYCIAYNATATPGTGALTGSLVLDFCFFDTTARGCSLSRTPMNITYSAGIVILVSSAASPYTYTTGTDTAAVTVDYQ